MTPLILNGVHPLALKRARDQKTVPAKGHKVRWDSKEKRRKEEPFKQKYSRQGERERKRNGQKEREVT